MIKDVEIIKMGKLGSKMQGHVIVWCLKDFLLDFRLLKDKLHPLPRDSGHILLEGMGPGAESYWAHRWRSTNVPPQVTDKRHSCVRLQFVPEDHMNISFHT